jgi:putative Mn2+ efflux pump MntP
MLSGIDPISLILLSVGLAMDAFSVATVTGFSLGKVENRMFLRMSVVFGVFHVFMPILGWLAGSSIVDFISGYDHWIAFMLLAFVGVRMIYESRLTKEKIEESEIISLKNLVIFSVAVSIDSMAVGLSFFLERIAIVIPSLVIGLVAFIISFLGTQIGSRTGKTFGSNTQILGGVILILIGIRIVVTHVT